MKHIRFLSWALLLACCPTLAAQETKIVKGQANKIVVIDAETKGEITWRLDKRLRDAGSHYKDLANKKLLVVAPGGTYEVLGVSLEGGKIAFTDWLVVIEGTPGPGPGPDPEPIPDTLETKFKIAFEIDKASGKGDASLKGKLATLYKGLAEFTDSQIIKTIEQAHVVQHGAVDALLMGNLSTLAKAADDYLHSKITEPDATALTQAIRDRLKSAMIEIGKAMDGGPGPIPVPVAGFKVLIMEEGAKRTPAFTAVISSPLIRDYLDTKATKAGWRVQDQNLDSTKDLPWVKELAVRPRASVPWLIIVGDGKVVFEGPLPIVSPAETLIFLKKFGG